MSLQCMSKKPTVRFSSKPQESGNLLPMKGAWHPGSKPCTDHSPIIRSFQVCLNMWTYRDHSQLQPAGDQIAPVKLAQKENPMQLFLPKDILQP